nr:reverse transcriptase domain-containing protein [Tanacetum cinerariifolium]
SPWVSPVHCVPKKGGFTVVINEENELIPTRLVTGWRVYIDYRKLNEATRKDHFPLPFMDQMLERLAGNEYYCFLDGFSGYFQIPIDPRDQEKTTFTCPYGTFAYRRMPFGLCNAPGTFQRCMLAIFHDMVEKTMEVFMDDFSVFGNSFKNCLSRLDKMLQSSQSTAPIQPTVTQSGPETPVSEPVFAPVSALMPNLKPSIPYPSRHDTERRRDHANEQIEKFYEIFKEMKKLSEMARTPMNEHCSAVILNKLPKKLRDPGKFLIPYEFLGMDECLALADIGASINLMPLSMWKGLSLLELTPTCTTLELADRSVSKPIGIAKDVSVKVAITYNLDQTSRYSANYDQMTANKIDVNDEACNEYSQEVLGFSDVTASGSPTPSDDPIVSTTSPTLTPFGDSDFLGGFTVVANEENELILTRLATGWRVCIDYRKLNEATRKDHFPLPFTDQMLERLAGNEYYCFLDGFSGNFQIPIDPCDQEKTTFTCPYGTFAYRRMPFGLCNASGMFQRCMLAIFHDMVEKMMEVFMDNFSVFRNSFESFLSRLDKMLQRCEDTKLCLNWEKSHFMVKEGIVL